MDTEYSFYELETKPGGRLFAHSKGGACPAVEFIQGEGTLNHGAMGTLWETRPTTENEAMAISGGVRPKR